MIPRLVLFLAVALLSALPAGRLTAQAASSPTYFLPAAEVGDGGASASTNFQLTATLGSGPAEEQADSSNFRLLGGLNAATDAPTTGRPWLTGVVPRFGPFLGGTIHTAHGTELDLGAATSVQTGGRIAAVMSRARDQVKLTLATQAAPGWQTVRVTNGGGTATLPRGIGILPMADKPQPILSGKPFRITYRGTQGDLFYLAIAGGKLPFAFAVPPYHHGLELNPALLIDVIGPFPVTAPNGEFHFDFPGIPLPRPLFVQMLGLPTSNPGYAPGCLTNAMEL